MEALRAHSHSHPPPEHDITWFAAFTTYLGYAVLIAFGRVRDFFGLTLSLGSRYVSPATRKGCAPLLKLRENFYNRRLYHRIQDCFNRPVGGGIGARCRMNVIERVSLDGNKSMVFANPSKSDIPAFTPGPFNSIDDKTGNVLRRSLNLGSYNYLGFADDWNTTCKKDVVGALEGWGVSNGGSRVEFGTTDMHRELEVLVANFLDKEDSLVLNMGFNTNATTITSLGITRGPYR